ncbi:unnamed protein product, partial [Scytosiphon promiscuus]
APRRAALHRGQELIPKYIDSSAVRVVSGGVEQTTELLAQK